MTEVAGQRPEPSNSSSLKKKNPSVDVGCRLRERAFEPTGYVLSYGSLARDCATGANPGRHQPSYGSVSLRVSTPPRYPHSVSVLILRSLPFSLSPISQCSTSPHHLHPYQTDERDNPSLFSFHPSASFPFFSYGVVPHLFSLSRSFSFSSGLILLLLPTDGLSTLSLSFSLPSLPLIYCLTLAFILAELHYDTFSSRELFHPPRRDCQPSRSDAFDHSRGYPIVRRVSAFSRFYRASLFLVLSFPSFASFAVYLCLTECNPFLPRNHH